MELKNLNGLVQRLQPLEPRLQAVCQISGISGCSIGVMHEGQAIWKVNNLDSITKGMAAAAFGLLVAEGKVEWTTPIREIVLEFASNGGELDKLLTPLDLLSMRSGNTMLNSMSW